MVTYCQIYLLIPEQTTGPTSDLNIANNSVFIIIHSNM